MRTIRLITCDDAMQAHIIQGALENEGIESLLHNENLSSVLRTACAFVLSLLGVSFPVGNYWTYVCNHCKATFDKTVYEKNKIVEET